MKGTCAHGLSLDLCTWMLQRFAFLQRSRSKSISKRFLVLKSVHSSKIPSLCYYNKSHLEEDEQLARALQEHLDTEFVNVPSGNAYQSIPFTFLTGFSQEDTKPG